MKTLALFIGVVLASSTQDFDVLIRNGRIVDGTGNPAYVGDLGIRGGKIVAMGRLEGRAARTIDATGLTVAPGFIDIHTYSDYTILVDGNAESMVRRIWALPLPTG
jgi:dihydroorotase/N-acyl-D-amino-acid deacylase